jgi:hypothetical protein
MRIKRRTILAGAGAAIATGTIPAARAAETGNPLAAFIAPDGSSIKAVRVTVGDDGHSRIANADIAADNSPYPLFKQFLTHNASRAAIYAAPPHHKIAAGKSAGKSLLFIVAGETSLKAGDATRRCPAGTVILLDTGSGPDLSEQAGPAGYTAIKVQLAD